MDKTNDEHNKPQHSPNGEDATKIGIGRKNGKNATLPVEVLNTPIPRNIYKEINLLLKANVSKHATKNKKTGYKTQKIRQTDIFLFFRVLFFLGYKIESIKNLKQKHLLEVFHYLEDIGQLPATISGKISSMRIFCVWLGKKGMVHKSTDYVRDPASVRRSMVAKEDLSWTGKGVDHLKILNDIRSLKHPLSEKVAVWLELCWAFGLRIQEAVEFMPIEYNMNGEVLEITKGTKGKRPRSVPIENDWQREILEKAILLMDKKTGSLIIRGLSAVANIQRAYSILRKVGVTKAVLDVTAHGLRYDYSHQQHKSTTGVEAPIKGGDISSVPREEYRYKMIQLMEKLGHSRVCIGASYYGSLRRRKRKGTE